MSVRVGWLDCSSGAAGDMLLAALAGAGAPPAVLSDAVTALGLPVRLSFEDASAGGLAARRAVVVTEEVDPPARTLPDVVRILHAAPLDPGVRDLALEVFGVLARAEASVHGTTVDEVHFHEVGALDALADVVGCAAGFLELGLDRVVVSPVALGSGRAATAHGPLPVPVPAVLEIVRGGVLQVTGGTAGFEQCTPTGAAVLAVVATSSGSMPTMTVTATGVGAGTRELPEGVNAVRLVVGEAAAASRLSPGQAVVLSTNVDDLDPRLWPAVLERLLAVGASDAWLTPVLMKKGRPAHTLSVLCAESVADAARRVVFEETSAIGLREHPVAKWALGREERTVHVDGGAVRVKVARLDGDVVNVQPEYDDVAAAARASGRPVKLVLADAVRAAGEDAGARD